MLPLLRARYSEPVAIEGRTDVVRVRIDADLRAPWHDPAREGLVPAPGKGNWRARTEADNWIEAPSIEQMRLHREAAELRNTNAPDFRKPTQEQLEERLEAARAHAQAKQDEHERAKRRVQLEQITRGISDTRARETAPPAKVAPVGDTRPRAWVDIETTGSDAKHHQIIELGLLVLEADNRTPRLHWSTLVQLGVGFAVDERALAVSGLDPRSEMFRDAPALRPALRYFAERLPPRAVLCGHNLSFDARFLRAGFEMAKLELPAPLEAKAEMIDTLPLARAAKKRGAINVESCSLGPLVEYFNARRVAAGKRPFDPSRAPSRVADKHGRVADENAATTAHRALADARLAAFVYAELLSLASNDNGQPQLALAAGGQR